MISILFNLLLVASSLLTLPYIILNRLNRTSLIIERQRQRKREKNKRKLTVLIYGLKLSEGNLTLGELFVDLELLTLRWTCGGGGGDKAPLSLEVDAIYTIDLLMFGSMNELRDK